MATRFSYFFATSFSPNHLNVTSYDQSESTLKLKSIIPRNVNGSFVITSEEIETESFDKYIRLSQFKPDSEAQYLYVDNTVMFEMLSPLEKVTLLNKYKDNLYFFIENEELISQFLLKLESFRIFTLDISQLTKDYFKIITDKSEHFNVYLSFTHDDYKFLFAMLENDHFVFPLIYHPNKKLVNMYVTLFNFEISRHKRMGSLSYYGQSLFSNLIIKNDEGMYAYHITEMINEMLNLQQNILIAAEHSYLANAVMNKFRTYVKKVIAEDRKLNPLPPSVIAFIALLLHCEAYKNEMSELVRKLFSYGIGDTSLSDKYMHTGAYIMLLTMYGYVDINDMQEVNVKQAIGDVRDALQMNLFDYSPLFPGYSDEEIQEYSAENCALPPQVKEMLKEKRFVPKNEELNIFISELNFPAKKQSTSPIIRISTPTPKVIDEIVVNAEAKVQNDLNEEKEEMTINAKEVIQSTVIPSAVYPNQKDYNTSEKREAYDKKLPLYKKLAECVGDKVPIELVEALLEDGHFNFSEFQFVVGKNHKKFSKIKGKIEKRIKQIQNSKKDKKKKEQIPDTAKVIEAIEAVKPDVPTQKIEEEKPFFKKPIIKLNKSMNLREMLDEDDDNDCDSDSIESNPISNDETSDSDHLDANPADDDVDSPSDEIEPPIANDVETTSYRDRIMNKLSSILADIEIDNELVAENDDSKLVNYALDKICDVLNPEKDKIVSDLIKNVDGEISLCAQGTIIVTEVSNQHSKIYDDEPDTIASIIVTGSEDSYVVKSQDAKKLSNVSKYVAEYLPRYQAELKATKEMLVTEQMKNSKVNESEEQNEQVLKLEKELEELVQKLDETNTINSDLSNQNQELNRKIDSMLKEAEKKQEENAEKERCYQDKIDALSSTVDCLKRSIEDLEVELKDKDDLEDELSRQEELLGKQCENLKKKEDEIFTLEQKVAEIEKSQSQMTSIVTALEEKNKELDNIAESYMAAAEELNSKEDRLAKFESIISKLREELMESSNKNLTLQHEVELLKENLEQKQVLKCTLSLDEHFENKTCSCSMLLVERIFELSKVKDLQSDYIQTEDVEKQEQMAQTEQIHSMLISAISSEQEIEVKNLDDISDDDQKYLDTIRETLLSKENTVQSCRRIAKTMNEIAHIGGNLSEMSRVYYCDHLPHGGVSDSDIVVKKRCPCDESYSLREWVFKGYIPLNVNYTMHSICSHFVRKLTVHDIFMLNSTGVISNTEITDLLNKC